MRQIFLMASVALGGLLALACGQGEDDGSTGTGAAGGQGEPPSATWDQACRRYCAREDEVADALGCTSPCNCDEPLESCHEEAIETLDCMRAETSESTCTCAGTYLGCSETCTAQHERYLECLAPISRCHGDFSDFDCSSETLACVLLADSAMALGCETLWMTALDCVIERGGCRCVFDDVFGDCEGACEGPFTELYDCLDR